MANDCDYDFEDKSLCSDCIHCRFYGDEMYHDVECVMDAGYRNFGSLFGCCDFVRRKDNEPD